MLASLPAVVGSHPAVIGSWPFAVSLRVHCLAVFAMPAPAAATAVAPDRVVITCHEAC